jgi:hypothetical protein
MKTAAFRMLAVALLVPITLNAPVAFGGERENLGVTAVELAQLPKFCWAEMGVAGATGPEFSISKAECGHWANHYCAGLVSLIRFKKSVDKPKNLSLLRLADDSIGYTEKGINDFPRCSIREHVAASRIEVNTLMNLYVKKTLASPPASR